jgi:O-acetyl-ADP-ribose deacetylase (regulator of RNase III)
VRVALVDKYGSLVDAAQRAGWLEAELLPYTDVREVARSPGTAFVSPANSLGFMDGGIDYTLSRVMFPGVEQLVKDAIAQQGVPTMLGRMHLPIGRAVVVPTPGHDGGLLVSAPTMWLPQDVRGTRNAYHATYAALAAASDAGAGLVVLPGMATGCGMVPADEAVAQMARAHRDFARGRPAAHGQQEIVAEQPLWYENTEFKHIDPALVVRHV